MWQPLSRVSDQRFQSQDLGLDLPISSGCRWARPCSTLQLSRLVTLPRCSDTAANSYTAATTTKHPLTKPSIAGTRHLPYAALAFCVFEACICSSFIQPHFRFPADTCLQRLRVPFSAGTVLPQPGAAEGRPVTHERLNFDFTSTRLAIVPLTSLS